MKFQDCFFIRPNIDCPPKEFDGNQYVGKMAIYCPQDLNNNGMLRIAGNTATYGQLVWLRSWNEPYQKENLGSYKAGPVGSTDPKDFRDSVQADDLFIIPSTKEGLIAEYNKLIDAIEMLDSRIAWMETKNIKEFSETEYRTEEIILEMDVAISEEKEQNLKKLIRENVKI